MLEEKKREASYGCRMRPEISGSHQQPMEEIYGYFSFSLSNAWIQRKRKSSINYFFSYWLGENGPFKLCLFTPTATVPY